MAPDVTAPAGLPQVVTRIWHSLGMTCPCKKVMGGACNQTTSDSMPASVTGEGNCVT